ncbi:uncharacterized protein EV154DRAFT_4409 [Mucor mucedo]|uniref:uncharacterized protein n=1 Tax=Mucor mucedo TaxID=29922 RepID=UPI00221F1AA2|nr:uncharacterized protein EV154DRAFT_4409 [Mucor mucedo]KAI7897366.1 hypothetical protein EV154DRAFT_4409 [Mucor mucedo]
MQVTVRAHLVNTETHLLNLYVNPHSETVLQVKRKVEKEVGILYENQRITFNSVELKNWQLLTYCGVKDGHELRMEESGKSATSFRVYLHNMDGNCIKVVAERHDTVYDLKEKLQAIEGSWSNKQRLEFEGKVLEEEYKTLADCHIRTGSELTMMLIK